MTVIATTVYDTETEAINTRGYFIRLQNNSLLLNQLEIDRCVVNELAGGRNRFTISYSKFQARSKSFLWHHVCYTKLDKETEIDSSLRIFPYFYYYWCEIHLLLDCWAVSGVWSWHRHCTGNQWLLGLQLSRQWASTKHCKITPRYKQISIRFRAGVFQGIWNNMFVWNGFIFVTLYSSRNTTNFLWPAWKDIS